MLRKLNLKPDECYVIFVHRERPRKTMLMRMEKIDMDEMEHKKETKKAIKKAGELNIF